MKKKAFVDPTYAKTGEYAETIKLIQTKGHCPFCPENFVYHKKPILNRKNGWLITESSHPYENAQHHFLIIGERHTESFLELTEEDIKTVQSLVGFVEREYGIKGGALCLRFGDTEYTGATVKHLHFHFIVPKRENGKTSPVYFPIG